jgi:hypothetical protein
MAEAFLDSRTRSWRGHRSFAVICAVAWSLALALPSSSAEYPLRDALDGSAIADFGLVRVEEDGQGGLFFSVSLNPDNLGDSADLHRLYFNLGGSLDGISGVTDDAYRTPYEIIKYPPVAGGAGIDFDLAVDFGKGAGKKGNGVLQQATFHVRAARPLSLADFGRESSTARRSAFAVTAHVQGSEISSVGGVLAVPASPELEEEESPSDPGPDPDPCNGGIFTCVPQEP